jgi:putative restriction endonuclease
VVAADNGRIDCVVRSKKSSKKALRDEFLRHVRSLRVDHGGGQRKPHKPLLLLLAIARLMRRGEKSLSFEDVDEALRPLLDLYAPPVKGRHQPELPYWHLQSDEVWRVADAEHLARSAKGFPTLAALRASSAGIPDRFANVLFADERLAKDAVRWLLDEHFEPSMHADVLQAVGFEPDWLVDVGVRREPGDAREPGAARAPTFRDDVLAAYDQRCAVTGFQAMLAGTLFALEAAHVQWHSQGGPSVVANGIALNPTMHKLFDHGAWTLTDDRRILVSSHFTGSDVALEMLRSRHKQPLRAPVRADQTVAVEFIRWHREPELGGVFREPAIG